MGNCQAIDAASLVIQHPSGKVDKMYLPVAATEIMKMNPGYYIALLITTTISHSSLPKTQNSAPTKTTNSNKDNDSNNNKSSKGDGNRNLVRITRVKLLKPTDTLTLGHVYRLISTKEVMKGLVAKKQAKMRKNGIELAGSEDALREADKLVRRSHQDKTHQVSRHGHRSRTTSNTSGGVARPKTWQPSLNSISEAAT